MAFTPLGDGRQGFPGGAARPTRADEEVQSLPDGVFFSARASDVSSDGPPALFYKDQTGSVRRVRRNATGTFVFAAPDNSTHFLSLGDELAVPEIDPRAWATARRVPGSAAPPELASLEAGSLFTAHAVGENADLQPPGVFGLGRDGLFRRLLKESRQGLKWSGAIPADRFTSFGQVLAVE